MEYQYLIFSDNALFDPAKEDLVIEDSELVLPKLNKKGFRMLILANGPAEPLRNNLKHWPFADYFEQLITSKEAGVAKPDPAFFDLAFAAFENPDKEDVMIIGADLQEDIQGGIDYGLDTCWWNPNQLETEDVELYNEMRCYEQLLDLV